MMKLWKRSNMLLPLLPSKLKAKHYSPSPQSCCISINLSINLCKFNIKMIQCSINVVFSNKRLSKETQKNLLHLDLVSTLAYSLKRNITTINRFTTINYDDELEEEHTNFMPYAFPMHITA